MLGLSDDAAPEEIRRTLDDLSLLERHPRVPGNQHRDRPPRRVLAGTAATACRISA